MNNRDGKKMKRVVVIKLKPQFTSDEVKKALNALVEEGVLKTILKDGEMAYVQPDYIPPKKEWY